MKRVVDSSCEEAVAIVEETVPGIEREAVPELLNRPFGDVEDDEDVNPLKRGGHHHEEVAREHIAGMIPEKRCPRLWRLPTARSRARRHVATHRAG